MSDEPTVKKGRSKKVNAEDKADNKIDDNAKTNDVAKPNKKPRTVRSKDSRKNKEHIVEDDIVDDDDEVEQLHTKMENLVVTDSNTTHKGGVGGKVGGGVVVDDGDGIVIELNNATKVQQFKTIFQNIKTFSKDLNIHLNTNSLYIQCMDNSKVSIFEMNLPASWFDKWVVPLNTVVGILTTLFFTILNLSENSIVIRYDHVVASDKLNIELMLEKCVITYELPLLDIENDVMEIPAMDYMVDMKMKSAFFFSIVDKLKKFGGENFDFECTEDAVKLFANTIEAGKISAVIQIADLTEYAIGEGESVSSFGLNYVYNIATFHKVADYIKIHFTGGEPLKMVYYLEPETADDGNIAMVTFYLAPKIDVNDDDM